MNSVVSAGFLTSAVAKVPTGFIIRNDTQRAISLAHNAELVDRCEAGENFESTLNVSWSAAKVCDQYCHNWCWATSSAMVASNYVTVNCKADEVAIVEYIKGETGCTAGSQVGQQCSRCDDQWHDGGSAEEVADAIKYKSRLSHTPKNDLLSQTALDTALRAGPLVLCVMWQGGLGGHCIAVLGGSGGSYRIHDPEGYSATKKYCDLVTYRPAYGGVGHWTATVYNNRGIVV
jgi:hypothetical protein